MNSPLVELSTHPSTTPFFQTPNPCGQILASFTSFSVTVHLPNVKAHPFVCCRKTIYIPVPRVVIPWGRSCSPVKSLFFDGYRNTRRECPSRCSDKKMNQFYRRGRSQLQRPPGEVTFLPENNNPLCNEHKSLRAISM